MKVENLLQTYCPQAVLVVMAVDDIESFQLAEHILVYLTHSGYISDKVFNFCALLGFWNLSKNYEFLLSKSKLVRRGYDLKLKFTQFLVCSSGWNLETKSWFLGKNFEMINFLERFYIFLSLQTLWLDHINNFYHYTTILILQNWLKVVILVANKADLVRNREIKTGAGKKMAMKYGVKYMETSPGLLKQ